MAKVYNNGGLRGTSDFHYTLGDGMKTCPTCGRNNAAHHAKDGYNESEIVNLRDACGCTYCSIDCYDDATTAMGDN